MPKGRGIRRVKLMSKLKIIDAAIWAKNSAKKYAESLALNGVAIMYPTINPSTQTWQFWDSISSTYIDTGHTAVGYTPEIGSNGNWWVNGVDTGHSAQGTINPSDLISTDANNPLILGTDSKFFVDITDVDITSSYVHEQNVASATWVVPHNLDQQHVNVQIVDNAGNTILADVDYTNLNVVTLKFSTPLTGKVIVRK